MITVLIPIIVLIVYVVLAVRKNSIENKNENTKRTENIEDIQIGDIKEKEEEEEKEVVGEINLEFYIEANAKENKINVLGDKFKKNSKFSVIKGGTKVDNYYYINHQFNKRPWKRVKIILYEDININNMLKILKYLYSVNMT